MEKLILNHYDKECMKMAMLKHEETFREQVYELHRLYRIQKLLMKDIARSPRCTSSTTHVRPEARCLDLERPAVQDSGNKKCVVVPEIEDDQNDLELTLGPRSYYHKKIKASEPAFASDSGPSFSSSSSGSSHVRGRRSTIGRDQDLQKWAGLESNQDRLNNNSPPWLFQALSLNMT